MRAGRGERGWLWGGQYESCAHGQVIYLLLKSLPHEEGMPAKSQAPDAAEYRNWGRD